MQAKEVTKRVAELCVPIAEQAEVTIWDVEFEKEGGQYVLTVYIDRDDQVELDHCEKVSRTLDPLLDAKEFASMPPYTLCVSSAGLERKLKKPEHFQKFIDSKVELRFYKPIDGTKAVEGILKAYQDGNVTVENENGLKIYEPQDIAAVRTMVEF